MKIRHGYSANYVRKIYQLLNKSFRQAVIWRKIQYNICEKVDIAIRSTTKEMIIWKKEEINRFLSKCKDEKLYILFYLAIHTGARKGELLGLRWEDIDFKNKVIQIRRTLSYVSNKGYVLAEPKTSYSKRKIPISKGTIKELEYHKQMQEDWKNKIGSLYEDRGLVICTEYGSYQDPRNVLRVLARLCKDLNLPKIRFHDFRHTHASILLSKNVDIVKVSKRLGHANPKITLGTYAHLVSDEQHEVADIFENVLKEDDEEL